jgi:hypothetical protein
MMENGGCFGAIFATYWREKAQSIEASKLEWDQPTDSKISI